MRCQRRRGTRKRKAMWCQSCWAVSKCALSVSLLFFSSLLLSLSVFFTCLQHSEVDWTVTSSKWTPVISHQKGKRLKNIFKPQDLKDFWLKSENNLTSYLTYVPAMWWCGYFAHFFLLYNCVMVIFGQFQCHKTLKICLSECTFVFLTSFFVTFLQYPFQHPNKHLFLAVCSWYIVGLL